MRVTVHYMAQLRRAAGTAEETLDVADGCTVAQLLVLIAQAREGARAVLLDADGRPPKSLLVFVNDEQVGGERVLTAGDSVTLLTPMAGG